MKLEVAVALFSTLAPWVGAQEWAYDPRGRRDPFLAKGALHESPRCEGTGRGGLTVAEVALRGVVTSPRGRVAMLAAPDGRSAFVVGGDRLCDGEVFRIEPDAVVLRQRGDAGTPIETKRALRPE